MNLKWCLSVFLQEKAATETRLAKVLLEKEALNATVSKQLESQYGGMVIPFVILNDVHWCFIVCSCRRQAWNGWNHEPSCQDLRRQPNCQPESSTQSNHQLQVQARKGKSRLPCGGAWFAAWCLDKSLAVLSHDDRLKSPASSKGKFYLASSPYLSKRAKARVLMAQKTLMFGSRVWSCRSSPPLKGSCGLCLTMQMIEILSIYHLYICRLTRVAYAGWGSGYPLCWHLFATTYMMGLVFPSLCYGFLIRDASLVCIYIKQDKSLYCMPKNYCMRCVRPFPCYGRLLFQP